jgi:hypothetical protein
MDGLLSATSFFLHSSGGEQKNFNSPEIGKIDEERK